MATETETPKKKISSTQKAAIILMSLGKDQAAEVMRFLSESEVKKISRAFMEVQEVQREIQQEIATEFRKMLTAANKLVIDGQEFAKDVIAAAFGSEGGDSLLDYMKGSKKESLTSIIGDIPENILDTIIAGEHPQTVAFILTKMLPDQAARTVARLEEELRFDVMRRLSTMENVKAEVVDEVREILRGYIKGGGQEEENVGGPKVAASILNLIDKNIENQIFEDLEETNPELASEIKSLMFTFEDIVGFDDRTMQTILKDVPRETLVLAIKTASPELKTLIFKNMSQRAGQMLKEDLEVMGPTKLKDVEKAQQSIIDLIRKLEGEGKIVIGGGTGGDVLV
ncbi:MAG: flagellar motor switch protein FliG [Deltaproteobacteria bacterium]|jgi:flagellar motor switch protein FliG|nr:flagellar motor switch protein FliG [Deltaproteobacteria bacterium]